MDGDRWIDMLTTQVSETRQGAVLVSAREAAEADDIGSQYCGDLSDFSHCDLAHPSACNPARSSTIKPCGRRCYTSANRGTHSTQIISRVEGPLRVEVTRSQHVSGTVVPGPIDAFSRRLVSRAYRPFIE